MIFILCLILSLVSSPARAIVGEAGAFLSAEDSARITSHTVALIDTSNMTSFKTCTATLISPDLALTAAHCVDGVSLEKLFIVSSPLSFAVLERHAVVRVFTPSEYTHFDVPRDGTPNFDLAIVRFLGPLPSNYSPSPVLLGSYDQGRVWTFVAGYGVSSALATDLGSLRISRVTHPFISSGSSFFIGEQNLGSGICHGDSGGPVFIRSGSDFILLGVSSSVVPRDPHHPEVLVDDACLRGTSYFNRAGFYRDWISSVLGK